MPGDKGLPLPPSSLWHFYDTDNLGVECDAIFHAVILEIPCDRRVLLRYCP